MLLWLFRSHMTAPGGTHTHAGLTTRLYEFYCGTHGGVMCEEEREGSVDGEPSQKRLVGEHLSCAVDNRRQRLVDDPDRQLRLLLDSAIEIA
jgi:hypothetical protein